MHYWINELWRLAYLVLGFGLLGWLIGYPGWGVALGLAVHMAFTLRHLRKLYVWLAAPVEQPPPAGEGVWGDLFDRLYRYQKGQRHMQGRLRAVINRVQESSEAMREGVIMLDSSGNLDWWNSAAQRLLALAPHHDRGQHLTNYLRDPAFIDYFRERDYREPLTLTSPIHDAVTLEVQVTLFGDDERLIVIRDVTRLHRLELMRRDFVANVSHELRTPLTVLAGYLETWLDHRDALPERLVRGLTQMETQTDRMQRLVSDLLTLSRLETADRHDSTRPFSITALCRQAIADGEALADDSHHFRLELDDDRWLRGDEQELSSALSNLIYNAVRYTPEASTVTLRYRRSPNGDGALEVSDDGDGIEPHHLDRLTERFYRVDKSRSVASGGTGLGLAIVKHVLLRHDARLEIESTPGQGALFRCVLPAARLMAAPAAEAAIDQSGDPASSGRE
ncbi:PAS/PAC sensor signal transduction histidine kinase [Kushneria sinocarnis]|uniref:Phosphate regulon sensor protein PhoR n=1 Tax=Kushneria sinocarnis TaxID=595502 RepID=A0A420X0L3_9GAMM|nr:phosphate regulon sensor histidine kinase PhoR [Kushneria sinocarnis]RKR07225.1 PAS/PAC sensor signal transduction histidine kinase [Kushneria sinocarnis]